jgi:hypothetical protein
LIIAALNTLRSGQVLLCRIGQDHYIQMVADMESPHEWVRRQALQTLVDFHNAPVGEIDCWPRQMCTDLQLTTMQAVFGEWLETTQESPVATEEKVIDTLFTFEPEQGKIEKPVAAPLPKLGEKWDRLGDIIKDSLLDWNAATFSTADDAPADEDAALGPLPREPFVEAMREKVTEAVEHVADLLAEVPNVRSLAACEPSVGDVLADLRGEAVALALEMRGVQEPLTRLDPPHPAFPRWLPADTTWPPAPDFPGGWVKKYRRIRRAGL